MRNAVRVARLVSSNIVFSSEGLKSIPFAALFPSLFYREGNSGLNRTLFNFLIFHSTVCTIRSMVCWSGGLRVRVWWPGFFCGVRGVMGWCILFGIRNGECWVGGDHVFVDRVGSVGLNSLTGVAC